MSEVYRVECEFEVTVLDGDALTRSVDPPRSVPFGQVAQTLTLIARSAFDHAPGVELRWSEARATTVSPSDRGEGTSS